MHPGIYLNLFQVHFTDTPVPMMTAPRKKYPQLSDLRHTLKERTLATDIFAVKDIIYGYGAQHLALAEFGFNPVTIQVGAIPQLATRLIIDGLAAMLAQAGYALFWSKQGITVFQMNQPILSFAAGLTMYRGFEIQSMYLTDPEQETLCYSVVIDPTFTYRDATNKPLRIDVLQKRYGSDALNQVLIKQGELTPQGHVNLEIAHQRLHRLILPFVEQRGTFTLSCGLPAMLAKEPMRIALVGSQEKL